MRTIPLNGDALDSAKELLIRAEKLGANQPDHYLIPARVNAAMEGKGGSTVRVRRYDPACPTKGWRTAWRKLTVKAGLRGLRGHDLRHNWVTAHAEIGTPQSVLEAQAGHLSKRMSDRYKHISEKVVRKASDELARVKTEQRAAVRVKLQEQAMAARGALIDSATMQTVTDTVSTQSVVVH